MSSQIDNTEADEARGGEAINFARSISSRVNGRIPLLFGSARIEFIGIGILLALTSILWFVMGDVLRSPEDLPGTDTYWHLTLIDDAFDRVQNGQPIGPVSESINAGYPFIYDTDLTYPTHSSLTGLRSG